MKISPPLVFLALVCAACSDEAGVAPATEPAAAETATDVLPQPTPEEALPDEGPPSVDPVADGLEPVPHMRAQTAAVLEREWKKLFTVEVQLLTIGHNGVDPPTHTRTTSEAEALAADLLRRLEGGEDMDGLVAAHDDSQSRTTKYSFKTLDLRKIIPGYKELAWRLEVGEVAVALFDTEGSPYGYTLVKRLE